MSEFEGYQEAAPAAAYEPMDNQQVDPEAAYAPQPVAHAEALPAEPAAASVADQAEGKVGAFVEKVGKLGLILCLCVSSLVYTIASGVACFDGSTAYPYYGCGGISAYAFSVGIISMVVSAVYLILLRYTQILADDNSIVHRVFAWFFLVWWIGGTGTGTFGGPFLTSSNGYFAAWASFFLALLHILMISPLVKKQMDSLKNAVTSQAFGDLVALLIASIVELIAATSVCTTTGFACTSYNGYAVSMGVVSIVVTAICIFFVRSGNASPSYAQAFSYLSIFLWFWWVVGTCVVTFHSPFDTTGNGYFASFAGCWFSTRLIRATTFWTNMMARMGAQVGDLTNNGAKAATYEAEPQYASQQAYPQNTDGMDF